MQLEQLLYLTKIVEKSSFIAASNELFISQQALSISIKKLEDELGCKLFERTKNGVHLLEEGKYVYKKAKEILHACDELLVHFEPQTDLLSGELIVAANSSIKEFALPKVISYFMRTHPEVHLSCITAENDRIVDMIASNDIDIGFIPYLQIDKNTKLFLPKNISFYPLYKFTFDCVISPASSFAQYKTISMSTILKKNIIVNNYSNTNMNNNIILQLIHHFLPTANIIEADSEALYWQLIRDNVGVSIHPHRNVALPDDIISISLSDNIKCYGGYILNCGKTKTDLLDVFLEKVKEFNQFSL